MFEIAEVIENLCTVFERPPYGFLFPSISKREASLSDLANLLERTECVKQIEQARIGRTKFTFQRIGRRFEQFRDHSRLLKLSGSEYDESDVVFATPTCTTSHLLQLVCGQRTPAFVPACIR